MSTPPNEHNPRPERYTVPANEPEAEIVIKNSVFIGSVARAVDQDAAMAFVERIRARYPDANHHAWAYRITGGPQGRIGFSDDGEPGGTAGRPMLSILEGSGLEEIVALGTRYFGGTKLGTGGLVRAYGGVLRETLKLLETVDMVLHHIACITVDYGLYGNLQYLLPRYRVIIEDEMFTDKATLQVAIPYDAVAAVRDLLTELTNGQIDLDQSWIGTHYVEMPPKP